MNMYTVVTVCGLLLCVAPGESAPGLAAKPASQPEVFSVLDLLDELDDLANMPSPPAGLATEPGLQPALYTVVDLLNALANKTNTPSPLAASLRTSSNAQPKTSAGGGNYSRCLPTLALLCTDAERSSTGDCYVCANTYGAKLKEAGCTSEELEAFCHGILCLYQDVAFQRAPGAIPTTLAYGAATDLHLGLSAQFPSALGSSVPALLCPAVGPSASRRASGRSCAAHAPPCPSADSPWCRSRADAP